MVSAATLLCCPACGSSAFADDEFCEACGAAIAAPRDAPRHHLDVDLGWVAAVSDRGLGHRRNEDAFHIETHGGTAVVVVCDGVSASTAPEIASQVAAEVAGRSMSAALGGGGATSRHPSQVLADALAEAARAVAGVPWLTVVGAGRAVVHDRRRPVGWRRRHRGLGRGQPGLLARTRLAATGSPATTPGPRRRSGPDG